MVSQADVSNIEIPHVIWWLVLLEGMAAFIVGLLILAAPGISALVITQLLGAFWFVSGIFSLVSIFMSRKSWGWKLASGILGLAAGLVVFQYPLWSAIFVPTVMGAVLGVDGIFIGVMRLVMGYRGAGGGMWVLGVLSILLGLVLLLFPPLALLTAVYSFAFFAIAGGIIAFFTALRLRRGSVARAEPVMNIPPVPTASLIPVDPGAGPPNPRPKASMKAKRPANIAGRAMYNLRPARFR